MTNIQREIKIDASKAKVWAIVANLGAVQEYHPAVSKSYYTSTATEDVGASRVCELLPMGKVEETAISWNEGESYKLNVTPIEKMPPFKHAVGEIKLVGDENSTTASFSVDYQLKFGAIGSMMDSLMIRQQFEKLIPAVLAGLKHHAETGEEVTFDVLKQARAEHEFAA